MLLVGLGVRLGLAWQDHRVLLAEFLWVDDSYLALSIARNLAFGHGMTSDGVNPTNGFQPLYVLLLVPMFATVGEHQPVLPVHLAGTLLAICGASASAFWFATARRLFSLPAALAVLFLFLFSTYFLALDCNGLETALYGLTLSATLYYYVSRCTGPAPPTRGQGVLLGVLSGAMVLARVDALLFVAFMVIDFIRRHRERSGWREPLARGAAMFVAVLAPWLAANVLICRSVVPVSGPAVRYGSARTGWKQVGEFVEPSGESFELGSVPTGYYANSALHLSAQVVAFTPLSAPVEGYRPLYPAVRPSDLRIGRLLARRPWVALGVLACVAVAFLVLPALVRRRRSGSGGGILFVRFPIVAWLAAYAFYVFGPWHSYRYLYPVIALLTLLSGYPIDFAVRSLRRPPGLRRLLLCLAGAGYGFAFVSQAGHYFTAAGTHYEPDRYTPVLPWLNENLPEGARIGAFQSGVLSYFLGPGRCVNLDGVVNAEALAALRAGGLEDYLAEQQIAFVVDWPWVVEAFLDTDRPDSPVRLVEVNQDHAMTVYRVERVRPVSPEHSN